MKPYIAAVGSTAVDEYYECGSWPLLGDKAFVKFKGKRLGGMISNAACVMGNYGNTVYLVDVLGEDEHTDLILDELKRYQVRTELIQRHAGMQNTKAMIFLCGGERSILISENDKPLKPFTVEQLQILDNAQIIYSSVNDFKNLPGYERWMQSDQSWNAPSLVLDVEPNSFQDAASDREVFMAAERLLFNEAGFRKWQGADDFHTAVARLFEGRVSTIVLTLAENGCRLVTREYNRIFPGHPVKVVDTTGAGDTFNATWITALMRGMSEDAACRLANAAAARSVLHLGARSGAVSWETVMEYADRK
jgi:ribokinase